jgi:hypothetical protein
VISFMPWPLYPWYPLNMWLDVSQRPPGRCGNKFLDHVGNWKLEYCHGLIVSKMFFKFLLDCSMNSVVSFLFLLRSSAFRIPPPPRPQIKCSSVCMEVLVHENLAGYSSPVGSSHFSYQQHIRFHLQRGFQ